MIGVAEAIGSALQYIGMLAMNSTLKDAMQHITLSVWSVGLLPGGVLLVMSKNER